MADNVMKSFNLLNYSGMLFNKGNTKVPFSTLIANKARTTNHVEFVTGLEYQTGGGEQPNISETASLIAPEATFITREQKSNVTQIFQESLYISYGKQSNMGTLSGLNISGQTANPATELDFQVAARMNKIARDIEYTFIRGTHVKSTADGTANRTRGMLEAIESNVMNLGGNALRVWDIAEALKLIYDSQGSTNGLVLWVDPVAMFQINADAEQNGNTIVPASRSVNGLAISTLLTPMGEVGLYLGEFLPAGTVAIFNPDVIGRVEQPVPDKGNFFMEPLAKVGAGQKFQIFGQLGLDHGPEWMHAKILGINPNFVVPPAGRKVYVTEPIETTEVLPTLNAVALNTDPVGVTTTAALTLSYKGTPASAPTLAYQWEVADAVDGTFENATGTATNSTYAVPINYVGKFLRCKVTATVTAVGEVYSMPKLVLPKAVTIESATIEDANKNKIVVVMDTGIASLATSNFEVKKADDVQTVSSVAASNANKTYTLTLSGDAASGEAFTVLPSVAGYTFEVATVTNNVA